MISHLTVRSLSVVVPGVRALKGMNKGSQLLGNAVELTLGPAGRTVVVDPFEQANFNALSLYPQPIITKDGVSVAKAINILKDNTNIIDGRLSNIGAKLLIDAASRTNEETGDGTTSCTVIAKAMLNEGAKYRHQSKDFVQLRKGIKAAVNKICENVNLSSKKITTADEVNQIALVSSNFDSKIAQIITTIYKQDPYGFNAISIGSGESKFNLHPSLEHIKGYSFS